MDIRSEYIANRELGLGIRLNARGTNRMKPYHIRNRQTKVTLRSRLATAVAELAGLIVIVAFGAMAGYALVQMATGA